MAKPDRSHKVPVNADEIPIVDAHHHLWKFGGSVHYPWLEDDDALLSIDHSGICRDYPPEEYLRDSMLHNVIASVHVEAEANHAKHQIAETEWVHKIHEQYGFPNAVVAHGWVDTDDADELLAKQASFPLVRGIRTKPVASSGPDESVDGQPRTIGDEKWMNGLGLLVKHDLSLDLRVPWWHLKEAAEIPKRHPDLRIALNHTGCIFDRDEEAMERWRRGMKALARHDNVWCKISFLLRTGKKPWIAEENIPIIQEAIEIFGVDRCFFASNFPVDGLKVSFDRLYLTYKKAIADLPLEDQEKLLGGNALKFYRIDNFMKK